MERRSGLFAELLTSLAVVMVAATALLAVVLIRYHDQRLHALLGRALSVEARDPLRMSPLVPGTTWWTVDADGNAGRRSATAVASIDTESLALAEEARALDAALLRVGAPWEPIRFALPLGETGHVAVARLPAGESIARGLVPGGIALLVLAGDVAIFTAFGATVLRRRVVLPLRRLGSAARAIADGDRGARVAVEGSREAAEVAQAFNEMTEALEHREGALTKAVADLRSANRHLRTAEAGLARAERLAAVGRLAAGVAHEVGNPMGALLAFVDLVDRDPALGPDSRSHLERARQQVERVRAIVRQLLDFSRPPRAHLGATDVAGVAEEVVGLVRAQRRYARVAWSVAREGEAPVAFADAASVSQILLNLFLNAADAVVGARGDAGGSVWVNVRGCAFERRAGEPSAGPPPRQGFDGVECRVTDEGPGIPPEDRERIFDPFYTTKPPGEGTGLGLANALRLAEEQGGSLELEPGPGGLPDAPAGATFVLRLRSADSAASCGVRTEVRSDGVAAGADASKDPQANR